MAQLQRFILSRFEASVVMFDMEEMCVIIFADDCSEFCSSVINIRVWNNKNKVIMETKVINIGLNLIFNLIIPQTPRATIILNQAARLYDSIKPKNKMPKTPNEINFNLRVKKLLNENKTKNGKYIAITAPYEVWSL